MKRFLFGLAALGLLAGCGIPGGLERPDPMWGSEEAIRRECTRELRPGERRDERCDRYQQQQGGAHANLRSGKDNDADRAPERDLNAPFIYDAATPPRAGHGDRVIMTPLTPENEKRAAQPVRTEPFVHDAANPTSNAGGAPLAPLPER